MDTKNYYCPNIEGSDYWGSGMSKKPVSLLMGAEKTTARRLISLLPIQTVIERVIWQIRKKNILSHKSTTKIARQPAENV